MGKVRLFVGIRRVYEALRVAGPLYSGAAVLFMMMSIALDTSLRKLANAPIPGLLIINENLMVGVVFLALAWTQLQGGHVRVSIFTSRLSARWQGVLNLFALLLGLAFFVLITQASLVEAYGSFVRGEVRFGGVVPIPVWPSRAMLALGSFLMCVELVLSMGRQIVAFSRTGR